jgi:hypothetical protein
VKRVLFAAFCILAFCSLLLINTGTVKAAETGYTRTDYNPSSAPTIDGKWTSTGEWTSNGEPTTIGTDVVFRSVWTMVSADPIIVTDTFLVEFFSDNTNDTGDYWQMCIDGDASGGAAPQTTDYRVDIVGHTNLTVYQGTGSGWTNVTTPASLVWADSISDSPTNSTPHWILEIDFVKADLGAAANWNFRLAAYDQSKDKLVAWPPTPRDEPNRWGVQGYVQAVYPEGFSILFVVLLSSVAVAVSVYFLRKRPKTQSYNSAKTGEINYTR